MLIRYHAAPDEVTSDATLGGWSDGWLWLAVPGNGGSADFFVEGVALGELSWSATADSTTVASCEITVNDEFRALTGRVEPGPIATDTLLEIAGCHCLTLVGTDGTFACMAQGSECTMQVKMTRGNAVTMGSPVSVPSGATEVVLPYP